MRVKSLEEGGLKKLFKIESALTGLEPGSGDVDPGDDGALRLERKLLLDG